MTAVGDSPAGQTAAKGGWARSLLGWGVLLAVVILVVMRWDQAAFETWKEGLSPFWFYVWMTVLPAFGVPTSPFYILAGASFGPVTGMVGNALAIAGNLGLVYLLGQTGLRGLVKASLRHRRFQLPEEPPRRLWRFTLIVKFAPGLPAFLKNYILVLSRVPFRIYFGLSFVLSYAYATAFFFLGDSLVDGDFGRLSWWLGALVLLALLLYAIRKYLLRRREEDRAKLAVKQD